MSITDDDPRVTGRQTAGPGSTGSESVGPNRTGVLAGVAGHNRPKRVQPATWLRRGGA